jgi:hypothetical protein
MGADRNRRIMKNEIFPYQMQPEKITAKTGANFIIEKLKKNVPLSIVHIVWIESICDAIEENAKRK